MPKALPLTEEAWWGSRCPWSSGTAAVLSYTVRVPLSSCSPQPSHLLEQQGLFFNEFFVSVNTVRGWGAAAVGSLMRFSAEPWQEAVLDPWLSS